MATSTHPIFAPAGILLRRYCCLGAHVATGHLLGLETGTAASGMPAGAPRRERIRGTGWPAVEHQPLPHGTAVVYGAAAPSLWARGRAAGPPSPAIALTVRRPCRKIPTDWRAAIAAFQRTAEVVARSCPDNSSEPRSDPRSRNWKAGRAPELVSGGTRSTLSRYRMSRLCGAYPMRLGLDSKASCEVGLLPAGHFTLAAGRTRHDFLFHECSAGTVSTSTWNVVDMEFSASRRADGGLDHRLEARDYDRFPFIDPLVGVTSRSYRRSRARSWELLLSHRHCQAYGREKVAAIREEAGRRAGRSTMSDGEGLALTAGTGIGRASCPGGAGGGRAREHFANAA